MTTKHLEGLIQSEHDSLMLAELADVPADIVRAWDASPHCRNPINGVRDIVVGEFIRRLVKYTLAIDAPPRQRHNGP